MNLANTWAELEGDTGMQHGYVIRRVAPEMAHDMYIGVIRPGGLRLFLLRVDAVHAPDNPAAFDSAGMTIHVTPDSQVSTRCAVEMHLTSPEYSDVFDSFIADAIEHVKPTRSDGEAVAALFERLRRWQQFLMRVPPTGLSFEAQLGLYGELWFLRNRLIPVIGARLAVAAWTGPSRANQDFQFRGLAAEVKTTTTKQPQSLRIASERQLDATGIERLVLVHLSLDARRGSGESLPDAVQRARTLAAAEHSQATLDEALFESGYLDEHAHRYEATGYAVRDSAAYEVIEGFPRIVEIDLRPGVGEVHYSISVGQCLPFRLTDEELRDVLSERLHG
ncbi:MAG TPA: PD-(D/E)XK motif protein [Tepidiformaceae bacterium]|nr:PD-(D/E)XK motif protein [Tepidiformaceae bacterium]